MIIWFQRSNECNFPHAFGCSLYLSLSIDACHYLGGFCCCCLFCFVLLVVVVFRNPSVFYSVAMLPFAGQTWRPLYGLFVQNVIWDVLIGWSCTGDWLVTTLYSCPTGDPLCPTQLRKAETEESRRDSFLACLCVRHIGVFCVLACCCQWSAGNSRKSVWRYIGLLFFPLFFPGMLLFYD